MLNIKVEKQFISLCCFYFGNSVDLHFSLSAFCVLNDGLTDYTLECNLFSKYQRPAWCQSQFDVLKQRIDETRDQSA